ncbi:MAG: apolipoprotein N-acyltransferase [Deltaproteobacteria bacterium CG_4_10_14_3_um_filter_60_8]|nr:MAG: apolipoprotein N-acyltransferase [Deltaproteobacteria bacterium CG23_combo_of_CG06-09_8_20_14_all_60_8]PIY20805.1 MAG: apolipoprotein N-acyltransferase [Deltaproteobacteria bacterium CG_4_10_14_3_um_filter_60_8]
MPEARYGNAAPGLAILAGGLLLMATPGMPGSAWLAWPGLVPLLWAIRYARPGKAFRLGLLCGLVFFTGLLYWIMIVLGRYGNLPLWITLPALLLLAAYMSLYTGIFAAGLAWARPAMAPLWLAPVLWVALDYLRGLILTGFPWLDLGYSQFQNLVIIQSADLAGHHGLTFLVVLANGLIFAVLTRFLPHGRQSDSKYSQAAAALLLLAAFVYGALRLPQIDQASATAEHLSVTVVQGNVPQDEKWVPAFQEKTVRDYLALSQQAMHGEPDHLLIWPETALPFYPMEHPLFRAVTRELMTGPPTCLLTGAPHRELAGSPPELHYYNSAFLLAPTPGQPGGLHPAGRYDKQHLVPFGEYIPLRTILPLPGPLVETMGDFTLGDSVLPLSCQKARLGVLICFESIFPDLARREVEAGATLLVNITNDAWFGRSSAPWQHLAMAVLRAVENRRSLARAANTGISGFVDPAGRTHGLSPLFVPYAASDRLPLLTCPTVFGRFGHHLPLACLLLLVPIGFFIGRIGRTGRMSPIKKHNQGDSPCPPNSNRKFKI